MSRKWELLYLIYMCNDDTHGNNYITFYLISCLTNNILSHKTISTYWMNKSHKQETFRTEETFSVWLFIPVLAQYLFTPVTHLFFFSLQLALPCGFLSHTGAAAERERSGWPSENNYGGTAATQKLSDGWGSCIYSWGKWQYSDDTHIKKKVQRCKAIGLNGWA